jgi:hypothetical protein
VIASTTNQVNESCDACDSKVTCDITTSVHAVNEVLIVYIPRFGEKKQKKTVKVFNSPEVTIMDQHKHVSLDPLKKDTDKSNDFVDTERGKKCHPSLNQHGIFDLSTSDSDDDFVDQSFRKKCAPSVSFLNWAIILNT